MPPSARDRVIEMARIVKKQLRGKTDDQKRRYLRGYWLVAAHQDPEIKHLRDVFIEATS
jgi:hypothetical protein